MLAFATSGPTCTLYNKFSRFQQKFVIEQKSSFFFHFDELVKIIQVQGKCIFRKLHKMTVVSEFWILIYIS